MAKPKQYTVADYNVTIYRGFIRKDGMKLWGIRKYKGQSMLDWRDQNTWKRDEETKNKARRKRQETQRKMIANIKIKRGCEQCGFGLHVFPKSKQEKYWRHVSSILQFDHLDTKAKLHNICDMNGRSWEAIQREINKCRVLCFPCHSDHSAKQRRG